MTKAFDEFSALARAWASFFRMKETTYIAIHRNDTWHLLYARVVFFVSEPLAIPPLQIRTKSIRAGQIRQAVDISHSLQTIIDTLASIGEVALDSETARVQKAEVSPSEHFDRLHAARFPGQARIPALTTIYLTQNFVPEWDRLQLELLSSETPYETFEELLLELGVPVPAHQFSMGTTFEIILDTPVMLARECTLNDNNLSLAIVAPETMDTTKIHVAIKAYSPPNSVAQRFSMDANQIIWNAENGTKLGKCSIALSDVNLLEVFVSYDGQFCHRWWVRDFAKSPNPRLQLLRLIGEEERFKLSFFDNNAKAFEDRVALFLSLMNLNVLFIGGIPELTDAVDIIALSGNNDLYLIECTTGDIDQRGKIQRLYDRARQIASNAAPPISSENVFPVVFSNGPRSNIAPHEPKLEALRVSVFCREDIELAFQRMEVPPPPEELRTIIQSLIPKGITPVQ